MTAGAAQERDPWLLRLGGQVLRGVYAAWWPVLRLRRRNRLFLPRRVLLYPYNDLSARYLKGVADLLRGDGRIALFCTAPLHSDHGDAAARQLAAQVGARHVPYLWARACWWDLILFASHGYFHAFDPHIQRILINHSLTGGKIINGQNTRYGSATALRGGRPIFSRMFEASEAVRTAAIAQNPIFKDVIALVGDLRADALLANLPKRDAIRRELGFGLDDTVLLIQSTFGQASLLESHGQWLLPAARRLTDGGRYRVMISPHPNHRGDSPYARRHPWAARAEAIAREGRGMRVLKADQPWERYMAAADLAITDHTANAAVFALLHRPMAFVPLPAGVVAPQSIEWRLYQACPHIDPRADRPLESALDDLLMHGAPPALGALAEDILSCPGEAAGRMTAELYDALQLPPPGLAPTAAAEIEVPRAEAMNR